MLPISFDLPRRRGPKQLFLHQVGNDLMGQHKGVLPAQGKKHLTSHLQKGTVWNELYEFKTLNPLYIYIYKEYIFIYILYLYTNISSPQSDIINISASSNSNILPPNRYLSTGMHSSRLDLTFDTSPFGQI